MNYRMASSPKNVMSEDAFPARFDNSKGPEAFMRAALELVQLTNTTN